MKEKITWAPYSKLLLVCVHERQKTRIKKKSYFLPALTNLTASFVTFTSVGFLSCDY